MVTEKRKKHVDLLPNGYKIVRQSLVDDLEGEKRYVGRQKFCRMMIVDLLMKSAGVCISIPVRTWLCRVLQNFCNHDWYAYGVLKHHSRFIRKSTIAEDGTVCHDTIEKVTEKHFL